MEKKEKIAALGMIGTFLFFVGPYGGVWEIIQGEVQNWILTGFTFIAYGIAFFFTYRLVSKYNPETKTVPPQAVVLSGAVFIMLYLCAAAFR